MYFISGWREKVSTKQENFNRKKNDSCTACQCNAAAMNSMNSIYFDERQTKLLFLAAC